MSRKEPDVIHCIPLKDSDHPCDLNCGMLSQVKFLGVTQNWQVCWACAARIMSGFRNTSVVSQ